MDRGLDGRFVSVLRPTSVWYARVARGECRVDVRFPMGISGEEASQSCHYLEE